MDHDQIAYLRMHSRAWRLLRADNAALVLAALGEIFVVDNVRSIAEGDLVARVDDVLHALNSGTAAYPRSAKDYVDAWAAPDQGWLRKYYPDGTTEPHYDATADLDKAYGWVTGLQAREFVGTESRLHTIVELLRQMVHGSQTDPAAQLAHLHQRRAELDEQIARAERGEASLLDSAGLADRFQHFATTARELLADFREVEGNFRALDRAARERITSWEGSKGALLDELVGDRHAIAASDQGRSFQAFYDFLLSRARQEELASLLDQLVALDRLTVDRKLRHVHHDWLDAAERTQQTVRQLSEQLRRFLDDAVWLENRRVADLLRSIERSALAVRHDPPSGLPIDIDAHAPRLALPMERPLYAAAATARLADHLPDDIGYALDADPSSLFDQVFVDTARIAETVRAALRAAAQVALTDLLDEHPPTHGLAELVGYLAMCDDDVEVVVDETTQVEVPYTDLADEPRVARMPAVSFARRRPVAGSRPGGAR